MKLLVLSLAFLSGLLAVDVVFDHSSPSEVLESSDGRIRGARNRTMKDFVLGGLFPIHTSSDGNGSCGAVRLERGLERMEAMLYSIDAINADDTLLPNITLGYDIRDTCSTEHIGLDETVDLVLTNSQLDIRSCETGIMATTNMSNADAPTLSIIGAAGSRVSVPVASLARLFTTPQISYASSSALLSNRERYGFFYRTIPPDNFQARAMVDIMLHFNWTYASTIYSLNTYGQPGIDAFHLLASKHGICIDLNSGIGDDFTQKEFENLAGLLLNSTANVVVLFSSQDNAASLFNAIEATGMKRKFNWIASDSWARSNSVASKYSRTVSGLIGFAPFTSHLSGFHDYFSDLTLSSNARNPWFREFFLAVANCTSKNHTACNLTSSVPEHIEIYEQGNFIPLVVDAVYTVANALHNFLVENCGQPLTWFSSNRSCLNQTRELNGTALLYYIHKSNFTSPTGNKIVFDDEGNVEGIYEIFNYQYGGSEFKFQSMGVWNSTLAVAGKELFSFNSVPFQFGVENNAVLSVPPESHCSKCREGHVRREVLSSCCGVCDPCLGQLYSPDPRGFNCSKCPDFSWGNSPANGSRECLPLEKSFLKFDHPYSVIIIIVAIAGFVPVAFTVVKYALNWNTPIVKSSGREQMMMLLVGVVLSFVSPFFFVSPPGSVVCGIQRWILWSSFSVMFSALLIKVVRVARIFLQLKKGATTRVRYTEPSYQVVFTLALVAIQWLILILSTAVSPPDIRRDVILNADKPNETPVLLYTCEVEHIVTLVLSVAYQTLLIILCTVLGIISFQYPENFNEAKYIAFCSFSVLVIWVAFVITFFATQSSKEYQTIVLSLAVVMTGYAVFATMFCQKLYVIVLKPERNSSRKATGTDGPNTTIEITSITRKEKEGLSISREGSVDFEVATRQNGQGTGQIDFSCGKYHVSL